MPKNADKKQSIERERVQYQQQFSEIENDLQEVQATSELTQVLQHLYGKDGQGILLLTDITKQELGKLNTLYTYARYFGFKELENLVINNLMLRVSLKRKGRDESVKIANAQMNYKVALMEKQSELDRRGLKR